MCLGIPMRIVRVQGSFAEVETGRLRRRVNVAMMPRLLPGDYVIVHAGFAIERVDPRRAEETLRLINERPLEPTIEEGRRRL